MKYEIKEILARLSRYVITPDVRHDFDDLLDYITNLQERNEKAIEYIKNHIRKDEFLNLNEWQSRDLLNILQGSDKE